MATKKEAALDRVIEACKAYGFRYELLTTGRVQIYRLGVPHRIAYTGSQARAVTWMAKNRAVAAPKVGA